MIYSTTISSFPFTILSSQGPPSACNRTYEVINCTRKTVFTSSLNTISVPKILISSVLANFLCDACQSADDALTAGNGVITDHIETLNTYSKQHPGVQIAVAPPLPRSVPDWFPSYLPVFATFLFHEITRMCNPNLKYLAPFVAGPSYFETDGIHLNADAGGSFIRYLVSSADLLFPPDSEAGSAPPLVADATVEAPSLSQLSQDVAKLRSDVTRRRLQDNLVFARIKEDRDFEINRTREDRCTISGVTVSTAPPTDPKERKEFFRAFISDLVVEALPEADVPPQVLDVVVNMRFGRGPPFFEVKFDSVASSLLFRIAASKLAKAGTGSFKGVFVSNTVNLSTRIRIDIMKLIAKRLTTTTEFAYVQGFSSRPTLHYLTREADPALAPEPAVSHPAPGTGRSYTFTESVERWGNLLASHSLDPIRRKAMPAFSGCLEQYFVVLPDKVAEPEADIFSRLLPPRISNRGSSSARGSTRGSTTSRGRFPHSERRQWRSFRGRGVLSGSNVSDAPSSDTDLTVLASSGPSTVTSATSLKRGPSPLRTESEPSKKK
jgi:hypothetical protein